MTRTEETVRTFAKYFRILWEHFEDNVWHLENYVLYCPGSNSITSEALTDFRVYRSVVILGVHTLRNGDPGYPDEYDEQEVGHFPTLLSALEKIGHCVVTDWIDNECLAQQMGELLDES